MYSGQLAQRALILDFNDEYGEYDIKAIGLENVPKFMEHPVAEIRRIRPFLQNNAGTWKPMSPSDMIETLEKVTGFYKGGCLLVEDINKYVVENQMPPDFTGKLVSKRHSDLDIILHYQSVARPLPIIWQNTNIVRFHAQMDPVLKSKNKLTEMTEVFQIAEILVNEQYFNQNNKRFFVYVSRDEGTIIGKFTYEMFSAAIEKYLNINSTTLGIYVRKYKMQGQPSITAYHSAMDEAKKDLTQKYWGNNRQSSSSREARTLLATGRQGVGKTYETIRYLREEYCVNIY